MAWSSVSETDCSEFPSHIRQKYRILLQKFKSLNVVFDEHRRNTRDIIDSDNEQGRRGSDRRRPKTPASVTWLYKSLRDEVHRLQEEHKIWKHYVKGKHSDLLQVAAMMIDLENNLQISMQGIEQLTITKDNSETFIAETPEEEKIEEPEQVQLPPVTPSSTTKETRPKSKESTPACLPQTPAIRESSPKTKETNKKELPYEKAVSVSVPDRPLPEAPVVKFEPLRVKSSVVPPQKIQKTKTRLSFKRQDTFDMPRLESRQRTLYLSNRQKTTIITSQSYSSPLERRNSIPLRRQSTMIAAQLPLKPVMLFRQRSQIGYPLASCFPDVNPLPPLKRSRTIFAITKK